MKKIVFALFGLLLAACSSNDDNPAGPASEAQMQALTGHWYAEVPLIGETDNWRTEEEDDRTDYDHIGTLIYLNGYMTDLSYWGYLYLKDGDMVNFDGIDRMTEDAAFDFTMNSDGDITTSSYMQGAPQVNNMHYDQQKDIVTASVSHNGQTLNITFTRPTAQQEAFLNDFWEMLVEAGMVGYEDDGYQLNTDVTSDNADETSRARRR